MPDGNPAIWHITSFINCLIKAELSIPLMLRKSLASPSCN